MSGIFNDGKSELTNREREKKLEETKSIKKKYITLIGGDNRVVRRE